MACGALVSTPVALAVSGLPQATNEEWAWAVLAGLGFVFGTACWLLGVRLGDVSIVTPIVATDGALAAAIAIATGEELGALVLAALAVVASGVVLVSLQRSGVHRSTPPAAIALALGAAAAFALVFTASGRTGSLGALWTVALTRAVGAALSLPPELLRRRVPPRAVIPWLAGAAVLDSAGFAALVEGAGDHVAVAAVLGSQYAVVAVIGGLLLYRERLAPWQVAGVALTMTGVATLAVARAG
jgi:drug/metabolite transporter (DMT)-like permease